MERVKHLAEIKGDRAFDAFADLIPPITRMAEDKEAVEFFTGNGPKGRLARSTAILGIATRCRQEFKEIEAIKRGCSAEEMEMSMNDIFTACSELMNDTLFICFFVLAHRDTAETASSAAPDPIKAPAE